MKTRVTVAFIIALAMIACDKGKFETVPSLRFISKNTDVVPVNESLIVTFEFTDKEGDVRDSIWVKKRRLNQSVVATIRDSLVYKIPTYPERMNGEFEITLDYQSILSAINPPNIPGTSPPKKHPDTLEVKFAVRDNAGNTSDYVSIGTIIVLRSL